MLVLTRKQGESIVLEHNGLTISVHILHTSTGRVSLGVDAPKEIKIKRVDPAKIAGLIG